MDNKDILEGNRLIAEFAGWERIYPGDAPIDQRGIAQWIGPDDQHWSDYINDGVGADVFPPFNLSWGLLMPVVEKISNLKTWRIDQKELSMFSSLAFRMEYDHNHGKRVSVLGDLTYC